LWIASQEGHDNIVELLLDNRADVNRPREDGVSPLFIASQEGHARIVELLLAAGADASMKNSGGCTPADVSSRLNHTEILDLLDVNEGNLARATTIDTTSCAVYCIGFDGYAMNRDKFKHVHVSVTWESSPDFLTSFTECFEEKLLESLLENKSTTQSMNSIRSASFSWSEEQVPLPAKYALMRVAVGEQSADEDENVVVVSAEPVYVFEDSLMTCAVRWSSLIGIPTENWRLQANEEDVEAARLEEKRQIEIVAKHLANGLIRNKLSVERDLFGKKATEDQ